MDKRFSLICLILIFSTLSLSACSSVTTGNNTENLSSATKTETKDDSGLNTYLATFLDRINLETQAYDNLTADYGNTDINNLTSLLSFQSRLPVYIKTFTDLLTFYQSSPPKDSPADLLDAISLIRNGTGKIVSGLNAVNLAITERSSDELTIGEGLINDGNNLYNQGIAKYNAFIDSRGK
jgi:hypothetical protein